jgi:hypothetical protein
VWPPETLLSIFGSNEQRHVLASEVSNEARRRLVDWNRLDLLSAQDAIKRLTSDANGRDKPPRPQDWTQLLALWRFVFGAIKSDYNNSQRRSLTMVPVEGDLELHPAAEVVRVSSRPVAVSDEDWAFLSDLLLVVDREWLEFLKATMSSEVDADPARSKQSEWLTEALRVLGLDGVTPMDTRSTPGGRFWDLAVNSADEAVKESQRRRDASRNREQQDRDADDRRRIVKVLRTLPDGETVLGLLGLSGHGLGKGGGGRTAGY